MNEGLRINNENETVGGPSRSVDEAAGTPAAEPVRQLTGSDGEQSPRLAGGVKPAEMDSADCIEKLREELSSSDECLAMVCEELEQHECLHGTKDMSATPPMMYPEAIRCRIGRVKKDADDLRKQLEWLWGNCKIVYYHENHPVGEYPIEHNPHATGSNGRPFIEMLMRAALESKREVTDG